MSLLQRIFGPRLREVKQSQSQAVMMLMYVGQEVAWMARDLGVYATEGYMACVDAYACIDLVAKAISGIPIVLEGLAQGAGGDTQRIDSHQILDLMQRPNPGQGQSSFIDASIRDLLISGNCYTEAAGPVTGPPRELYAMKPSRVRVLIGNPQVPIAGYRYTAGGDKKDFPPSAVLHHKFYNPNPREDFYGLAPIEIAARAIDTSNLTALWNGRLAKNDFRPSGFFMIEREMGPEWEKQFNENIKAAYTGDNMGSPMVLTGGKDFKPLSMTPKDADFLGLDKLTTLKICRVFNVAPELVGVPDQKTYANYQEARLALYMETAIPLAQWWLDELNNWLMPKFEGRQISPGELRPKPTLRFAWDIDKILALQEKRNEMYLKLKDAWWMEINERRKACGLGDWENGEGNVLMIPMGLSAYGDNAPEKPAPVIVAPASPVVPNKEPAMPAAKAKKPAPLELKGFWAAPERKRALWDNFESRVKAKEKPLLPEVERFLRSEAKRMRSRAAALPSIRHAYASEIADPIGMAVRFKKAMLPRYTWMLAHAGAAGMHVSNGKTYDPVEEERASDFALDDLIKKKLSDLVMNSGKYIGEETMNQVGSMIAQAQAENWTVQELAQGIAAYMDDRTAARSRLIARTETAKVENWGEVEGYRQTEFVEKKGWLCAFVEDSREAHKQADADYKDAIPLDEPFVVGGEDLQYPGDPNGSAGNVINCLCTTFPEVGEG